MNSDYIFQTGEPSILVEIYLPKKSVYQGVLYQTLTKGFTLDFQEHFKSSPEKEYKIKELLKDYFRINEVYDKFVENNERVFYGYSLYEVDGVFCGEKQQIYEERTQIIKIIFKPDIEDILHKHKFIYPSSLLDCSDIRFFAKKYFRSSYQKRYIHDNQYYLSGLERNGKKIKENELEDCLSLVEFWKDSVGLFLFGYLMYELSHGVNKLEDEIWVTSCWNFNVNRIQRRK